MEVLILFGIGLTLFGQHKFFKAEFRKYMWGHLGLKIAAELNQVR